LRRHEASAVALERVQPLPPEAIDALAEAVKAEEAIQSANPNDGLQFYALQALSNAGAPAIPALAALTKSEKSTHSRARDSGIGSRWAARSEGVANSD